MLKARIGLYSAGLNTYWAQFAGLKDRLLGYNSFIAERLSQVGEVYNFGLVDDETAGRQAGEYFNATMWTLFSPTAPPISPAAPCCPCIRFAKRRQCG